MFTQTRDLKKHERIHTGVKPYACSTCGKMFTQNNDLIMRERIHTSVKSFACSIYVERCLHKIQILKSLNVFIQVLSHNYACANCGKMFTRACTLKVHERIHTGVKL